MRSPAETSTNGTDNKDTGNTNPDSELFDWVMSVKGPNSHPDAKSVNNLEARLNRIEENIYNKQLIKQKQKAQLKSDQTKRKQRLADAKALRQQREHEEQLLPDDFLDQCIAQNQAQSIVDTCTAASVEATRAAESVSMDTEESEGSDNEEKERFEEYGLRVPDAATVVEEAPSREAPTPADSLDEPAATHGDDDRLQHNAQAVDENSFQSTVAIVSSNRPKVSVLARYLGSEDSVHGEGSETWLDEAEMNALEGGYARPITLDFTGYSAADPEPSDSTGHGVSEEDEQPTEGSESPQHEEDISMEPEGSENHQGDELFFIDRVGGQSSGPAWGLQSKQDNQQEREEAKKDLASARTGEEKDFLALSMAQRMTKRKGNWHKPDHKDSKTAAAEHEAEPADEAMRDVREIQLEQVSPSPHV